MTPRTSSGRGYRGRGADNALFRVFESSFKDLLSSSQLLVH